jgi:L-fucono-1,5-lactonase
MLNRREFLGAGALAAATLLPTAESPAKDDESSQHVDCHTHFYDPTRPEGIPWPGKDDRVLYRTVLPRHFLEQAAPLGVKKTVVVEASPRVTGRGAPATKKFFWKNGQSAYRWSV